MGKSPSKPTKDSKAPIKPIMTMEEFHRTLPQALVDNLNRNVLREHEEDQANNVLKPKAKTK
jgi:hypothetical protein